MQKILFILSEFDTNKTKKLAEELRSNADYPENKLIKLYNGIFNLIEAKRKDMRDRQQKKLENIRHDEDASSQKMTDIDGLLQLI